jgi:hypothetical protein
LVVVESVAPRVRLVPESAVDFSLADEALEWLADHGFSLFGWQADVLRSSLGLREDGTWAAKEVGLVVPRQNGKGVVLEARELVGLYLLGEREIIHTAHEYATAQEHYRRVEAAIRDDPEMLAGIRRGRGSETPGLSHSHGDLKAELQDGRRILFRTRTKAGSRGFTGEVMIFDEAMIFPRAAHASGVPILRARSMASEEYPRGVQFWYSGSAVDQDLHEHGTVLASIRERGHAGDDPTLAYFEWSVDCDDPTMFTDEMALDPACRRQANPSLGILISEEHMDLEYRAMDLRSQAVELYGVGDWPSLDETAGMVITPEEWAALTDVSVPPPRITGEKFVAVDVSPERKTAIVIAGWRDDGLLQPEVIQHRQGTGWVADRLVELTERHDVAEVLFDGYGPAASVATRTEAAGVRVRRVNSSEVGQACARLVDLVGEKRFRHLGSQEVADAVRGAKPRPLGDSWAWSRRNSTVDISPLVAMTLALWAASDHPDGGDVVIY